MTGPGLVVDLSADDWGSACRECIDEPHDCGECVERVGGFAKSGFAREEVTHPGVKE
jgi:hypothetical protein